MAATWFASRTAAGTAAPQYLYRLAVRPPRPDFSLTVSPVNPRVAAGGTVALAVTAQRRDGFDGEISLSLPQPPPGATRGNHRVGRAADGDHPDA